MSDSKDFYKNYHDEILEKRVNSPYALRRYAHEQQYLVFLKYIKPGMSVLDAGCGEGVLSIMLAKAGAKVTATDISQPNIEACHKYVAGMSSVDINFLVADSENLPFADNSFDLVVSSHVLEHLPDFDRGLQEIMRVTKKRSVIAIPTVTNLCSLVQVGRGAFWIKRPKSFLALLIGTIKMFLAFLFRQEGVNETYAGQAVDHIFRFPWIMKNKVKKYGYRLVTHEASCICLPYFEFLLPLIKLCDKFRSIKFWQNLGYGTTYVIDKK